MQRRIPYEQEEDNPILEIKDELLRLKVGDPVVRLSASIELLKSKLHSRQHPRTATSSYFLVSVFWEETPKKGHVWVVFSVNGPM